MALKSGTFLFMQEYYSFAHCMAGGCASVATSFIFTPSERIKQQMQVGSHYQNCWYNYKILVFIFVNIAILMLLTLEYALICDNSIVGGGGI